VVHPLVEWQASAGLVEAPARDGAVSHQEAGRREDSEEIMDQNKVDAIPGSRSGEPFDVIEAMQDLQEINGYLPEEALRELSESLDIPLIELFSLANFYKAFSLKPRGRHLITVCAGTACHVRGAPRMLTEISAELGIQPGETTDDQAFTLETVNCLGACALGPVVVMDGKYHDKMTAAKLHALLESVKNRDREMAANV
jgi:NADH:ubiquinone oxidoreductase subunit E